MMRISDQPDRCSQCGRQKGEASDCPHRKDCPWRRFGERLAAQIAIEDRGHTSPCWVWKRGTNKGYARAILHPRGERKYVHRTTYEAFVGGIPNGMELDHLCRVKACVNPDHLEPVAHAENVRRGLLSLTNVQRGLTNTHCRNGHEYTPENTHRKANHHRACRICLKEAWRSARARARAQRGRSLSA